MFQTTNQFYISIYIYIYVHTYIYIYCNVLQFGFLSRWVGILPDMFMRNAAKSSWDLVPKTDHRAQPLRFSPGIAFQIFLSWSHLSLKYLDIFGWSPKSVDKTYFTPDIHRDSCLAVLAWFGNSHSPILSILQEKCMVCMVCLRSHWAANSLSKWFQALQLEVKT